MSHIKNYTSIYFFHDNVIKWKLLPCYGPFVRGIHQSPVNSPHKGQWHGALMFSLISTWLNGQVNNWEAGDLRRHLPHYDVTVMNIFITTPIKYFWSISKYDPYVFLVYLSEKPIVYILYMFIFHLEINNVSVFYSTVCSLPFRLWLMFKVVGALDCENWVMGMQIDNIIIP